VRDETPARVFTLDGRPVVFIFGSHTWGLLDDLEPQFAALDDAFDEARQRFAAAYGSLPYVIGEEIPRSHGTPLTDEWRRRTANFDAAYAYLHSTNLKQGTSGVLALDQWYIDNQVALLRATYDAVRDIRNRFTDRPILVIPSLAPGFAKQDYPTLQVNRSSYTAFMKTLVRVHRDEHLVPGWQDVVGSPLLPAPIYSVGSWNEEFEGHCVFPTDWNLALSEVRQEGFDLPMAIKEVFGWNHYSDRGLLR
jgi:hypothetical protein